MTATVEAIAAQIETRLGELRDEVTQLERAREALVGTGGARGRHTSAATRTRRRTSTAKRTTRTKAASSPGSRGARGRPRGSGKRGVEALGFVQKHPGITIPELATKMGIKQNYLYRVMPTLASDGKVVKKDKGWHPAS